MREWKFFYKFESKDQIFAFTKSNQIPYQYLDKNLHNVNSAKSSKVKLTFKWCSLSVHLRHLWGNKNRNMYIEMRMNGLFQCKKVVFLAYKNIKRVQYRVMHKFSDMKWAIHGKLVHTSKKNVEKPNEK